VVLSTHSVVVVHNMAIKGRMKSKVIRIPPDLVEAVEDLIEENEIRKDRRRYMKTNASDWYLKKVYRPKRDKVLQ